MIPVIFSEKRLYLKERTGLNESLVTQFNKFVAEYSFILWMVPQRRRPIRSEPFQSGHPRLSSLIQCLTRYHNLLSVKQLKEKQKQKTLTFWINNGIPSLFCILRYFDETLWLLCEVALMLTFDHQISINPSLRTGGQTSWKPNDAYL